MTALHLQTKCTPTHHGAASNSSPHSLKWVSCPSHLCRATDNTTNNQSETTNNNTNVEVLLYPSSGVLNLVTTTANNASSSNSCPNITAATLVTQSTAPTSGASNERLARGEAAEDAAAKRSITCLDWVDCSHGLCSSQVDGAADEVNHSWGIVTAFSDGTVTSWRGRHDGWREYVLIGNMKDDGSTSATTILPDREVFLHESMQDGSSSLRQSIADVSVVSLTAQCWMIGTASSNGVILVSSHVDDSSSDSNNTSKVWMRKLSSHAATSIQIIHRKEECWVVVGSASPRHNKIWVYTIPTNVPGSQVENNEDNTWVTLPKVIVREPRYQGCLLGHQDWITCFDWLEYSTISKNERNEKGEALLASSGHDAKIRLWKFTSVKGGGMTAPSEDVALDDDESNSSSEEEDEANIDDLEEGEARLVMYHSNHYAYDVTSVSLEALLLGHEEAVTSVSWRRDNDAAINKVSSKPCLLSSSMDRSILIWMEQDYERDNITCGVWTPISRVGSAGGILGGSIGASLMGFVDAAFSPGGRIVGHGYGGSLHFWSRVVQEEENNDPAEENREEENEDVLLSARWLADPCITGHFRPVLDLAWDPRGEYLLTTGSDQTTRLWAEVNSNASSSSCCWTEVGRPQVHGYDMTTIVCIGGDESEDGEPPHRFVSGADEKLLRVFDAPVSTLRLLTMLKRHRGSAGKENNNDSSWRIERAFLPSLGLSNKATADPEQESSKYAGPTNDDEFVNSLNTIESKHNDFKLPSERDLGVTTLWPETRKLFGHDSELVCLDAYRATSGSDFPTIVASSCKARNDVASAAIRLWNVKVGKCIGVLKGGHRSTVSTLSFSKDGKYLASSGKDRRICVWKRQGIIDESTPYDLSAAKDSAHKRIVWSVHFCPSHPNILASGSRDGVVKVWRVCESTSDETTIEEIMSFEPTRKSGKTEPVTAVAFAESTLNAVKPGVSCAVLGVGTESGYIEVWSVPILTGCEGEPARPTLLHSVSANNSHFYTVNGLAWRPLSEKSAKENKNATLDLTLASCGEDSGVRIFNFTITQ